MTDEALLEFGASTKDDAEEVAEKGAKDEVDHKADGDAEDEGQMTDELHSECRSENPKRS